MFLVVVFICFAALDPVYSERFIFISSSVPPLGKENCNINWSDLNSYRTKGIIYKHFCKYLNNSIIIVGIQCFLHTFFHWHLYLKSDLNTRVLTTKHLHIYSNGFPQTVLLLSENADQKASLFG